MDFVDRLKQVKHATSNQKRKELWDVEGILNNQPFRFDLRPLKNYAKGGSFKTKADKMVFDMKDQYIIVDIEELHQYLRENNVKDVQLEDLISKLDWNIILPK
jgi:oligoribonuclease NrnB/cAMP/cGMP phosphodiesterase (DHH superfamily)